MRMINSNGLYGAISHEKKDVIGSRTQSGVRVVMKRWDPRNISVHIKHVNRVRERARRTAKNTTKAGKHA